MLNFLLLLWEIRNENLCKTSQQSLVPELEKSLVEGGGSTVINFNPVISNSIGDMSATAVQTEEPKG